MNNLINVSRITLLLACLLALQGCFENSGDQDKDHSKASVQMSEPESRDNGNRDAGGQP
ncbi:hypothetical protein H7A76_27200 [Pseudomonas sp. MSSRFD41]|uniref:hypothetical protein n=1 Tax=unclassified Pseudomonas TaxID=196821 RepID=UPI00163AA5B5|nr:hypothetical protein [Pseudomonas sp. MSSRFD41]MBC2659143.1 hypothetical protein [Pseudomonas sp. MSSRFD41]